MAEVTISVRIDEKVHQHMKLHEEINWSAVVRKSIVERLENLEKIDVDRAKKAAKSMDEIRKAGIFDKGRPSVEIIREWREKRR
ncbi:hypothetical protein HY489_03300 [Candidatus Woesearchaeota archaeon]|nr:hypothetical protein [Candidatus Woesearchaeota archaeon]